MNEARENRHASHLKVLGLIFNNSDIKNVFEYGCGNYSTKFFVEHALSVVSVEMNKIRWYEHLKTNITSEKLNLLFMQGDTAIDFFKNNGQDYDFIFVDGDGRLRKDCVQTAMGRSDIIAVHDIDLTWRRYKNRGWLNVSVPENYRIIVMNQDYPSTTVYTANMNVFEVLKQNNGVVIR